MCIGILQTAGLSDVERLNQRLTQSFLQTVLCINNSWYNMSADVT